MLRKFAHPVTYAVVLGLMWLFLPLPNEQVPQMRHFTLNAVQYEFAPYRLEVNQGDDIVFALTATDVVHGFYLDGYGVQQRIEPGIMREVRFTADQAGKFRFRCSVSCGPLHPFMIGELVVRPNLPFWRAAGLLLTAFIVFLWQLRQRGNEYGQNQKSFAS